MDGVIVLSMRGSAFMGTVTHPNLPQLERGTVRNTERKKQQKGGTESETKIMKQREVVKRGEGMR